jgi:hypothetical protein
MHEWNNKRFRDHVRYLIMRERTRFVCIQLHDICDEEVEDYFRSQLQIPRFVALEDDEFMFWHKLYYHLYTNDSYKTVMPAVSNKYRENDAIDFDKCSISRPIIHLDGCRDPYAVNNPDVSVLKTVVLPHHACEFVERSPPEYSRNPRRVSNNSDCECLSDRGGGGGGGDSPQYTTLNAYGRDSGRVMKNADFEFGHSQANTHRSASAFENQAKRALVFTNKAYDKRHECDDTDSC